MSCRKAKVGKILFDGKIIDLNEAATYFLDSSESEDDGSLVLLHHLHHEEEGDGERDHDEEQRADGHDEGADPGTLLANCQHSG